MELQIKTKTKLTNGDQYNKLVEFMVENPTLASYTQIKTVKDKMDYNTSWEDLSQQLNMKGPPMRTMEEWKKVWKDYKYHIKKKCYVKQKMDQNGEGPLIYKKINFNDNELAIIDTLKLETLMPRCKKLSNTTSPVMIESATIKQENFNPLLIKTELSEMVFEIADVNDGVDFIDTTSSAACHLTKRIEMKAIAKTPQDASQVEDQIEIEKQIRKLKMEKVIILRQTSELNQRHLELKEKIHELKERKFEMKCKRFNDESKYKTQKLELKKRELELKEFAKLHKEMKLEIEN